MPCLFCSIADGSVPSSKVFESEHLYAFLDLNPANPGHTLLIPKGHCPDLLSVDPGLGREFLDALQRIARAVLSVTGATGFNLVQNNGRVAGQVIEHLHWHIIPRHENDTFPLWTPGKYETQEEMDRLATAIKVQIGV